MTVAASPTRTATGVTGEAIGEIEVLIAEARARSRRRRRRIRAAVAGTAVLTATMTAVMAWVDQPAARIPPAIAAPARSGSVTGYIGLCWAVDGLPPPTDKGLGGVVEVLRGHLWYQTTPVREVIIPGPVLARVVTSERIQKNREFSFRLPPGHYILLAHVNNWPRSYLDARIPVSVTVGGHLRLDIPTGCL